jgi:hypothetical protein
MSTYELHLDALAAPVSDMVVKYYSLLLKEPLRFDNLAARLGSDLFERRTGRGAGVFCFATANCNRVGPAGQAAKGRLYVFLSGCGPEEISRLDRNMARSLEECGALVVQ